jgi:hypothetical protein
MTVGSERSFDGRDVAVIDFNLFMIGSKGILWLEGEGGLTVKEDFLLVQSGSC